MADVYPQFPTSSASFVGIGGERRFGVEIERVTASAGTSDTWLEDLKRPLHQLLAYDSAWMGWRDPETQRYLPVLRDGQNEAMCAYFSTEAAACELERLGFYRAGWPMVVHRAAATLAETSAWRDYLSPAGFRDGLWAGLFSDDGRQIGFLSLLTYRPHAVTVTAAALLHTATPLLGSALDRRFRRGTVERPSTSN